MDKIGPSFASELIAAGLADAPISWTAEGVNYGDTAGLDGITVSNPGLTQQQRDAIAAVLADHDPTKPAPVVVPAEVTRYQARRVLAERGLLSQVQAYFDALPDTDMSKLAWNEAPSVRRDSEALIAAAHALGLTDEQIDQMFVEASQIK
ncbi:hypothetical protein CAL29_28045 [Bordetella genomosp. 10]|uniref:Uncharacterized protein n=1 Tax=Bordetella genomosp. 10 TaxID=1416804 RepID=A0A261S2Z4_9BORD|nr:hypothetical protein [Bordetella genomosp. 10]OZI31728.1 hypothetical protein CAL29_28045 [Bordetella genomosp. 10]